MCSISLFSLFLTPIFPFRVKKRVLGPIPAKAGYTPAQVHLFKKKNSERVDFYFYF